MQIKTQLRILFGIAILTVGGITVSMAITNTAIDEAITYNRHAYEITYEVSILHRLASELTQNNYDRVERQWNIVMQKLRTNLNTQPKRFSKAHARLQSEEEKTNLAFQESIRIYQEENKDDSNRDFRNVQFLSRNHLAVVLAGLVTIANDMMQDSYLYMDKIRHRHTRILVALASVNLLFLSVWLLAFWKAIMTPLRKIIQAIQVISRGHLQHRIPLASKGGEMHTLINTFNSMLDRVQELTVSRKQLLLATESERTRIGRELHDGITQTMVGARLKLEAMSTDSPTQEKQRREILYHLAQAQQDIGRIVKDIHPAMLDDHKLIEALQYFARQNSDRHKITLNFGLEEQDIPLPLHIPIYRIVQEATHNAIRHGKAQCIHIQMHREDNTINLFIEDDGQGFDSANVKTGNGLINIRERVAAEGGELTIDSAPGRGCCIIASFPLNTT